MTQSNTLPQEMLERGRRLRMLETRLACSIGLLVIRFNRLESGVGELLAVFLQHTQEELFENISIMTAALSFSQKLDLLVALYLKRYASNEAQCALFRSLISELSAYEEFRNACVHSRWGTRTFGDDEFMRFKANVKGRKGLREVALPADWREIRKICREMDFFDCIEMTEIYRGCREHAEMSPETIESLKQRLTLRSIGPARKAAQPG
jgi:hypothetical protein